jgi:SulP family sulfate permease
VSAPNPVPEEARLVQMTTDPLTKPRRNRAAFTCGHVLNVPNSCLMSKLPGVDLFRTYSRRDLRPDLLAGLTVTALLIPSGLAYGELAGVSPVAGLYTGVVAMVIFALFSSSRRLIVGPESQISILIAAALAPIATGTAEYASAAAVLALLTGAWTLVGGFARVGFLADYMSQAVLVGYLTGVALIIAMNQVAKLLGGSTSGETLIEQTVGVWEARSEYDLASATVGVVSLVLLVLLKRFAPRFPGALVIVVVMTAASALLGLAEKGVAVIGDIPRGLPLPAVPETSVETVVDLAGPALGIALVLFANTVLSGRAYANRGKDPEIDPNQELRALGFANLGTGLWHGFSIGASDSRTAVSFSIGGRTQMVGMVAAAGTVLFLIALAPLVADLPLPTLAAIVLVAAASIVRAGDWRRLFRFRRREGVFALVTLIGVAVLGILAGIILAVVVNLLELISRLSRPDLNVLGPVDGSARWRAVSPDEAAELTPRILAVRISGPLFFANARYVVGHVKDLITDRDDAGTPVRVLILNLEGVTLVDLNGADELQRLLDDSEARGYQIRLARVRKDLEDELIRGGVVQRLSGETIFDRVSDAAEGAIDFDPKRDPDSVPDPPPDD